MTNESGGNSGGAMAAHRNNHRRQTFGALLHSDPTPNLTNKHDVADSAAASTSTSTSAAASPYYFATTPTRGMNGNNASLIMSPYTKSPWIIPSPLNTNLQTRNGIIGSLVRQEGHVYSLATSGDLLYTGSESKNIRVWKNLKEFSGFKSNIGFVKSIVIHQEKVFTGHQDGKIRIWKASMKSPNVHKRIGSLPTFRDFVKNSIYPRNYVQVRRRRNVLRIRHYDAVSCLSLDADAGLLYSGSWDKTLKVWGISDLRCLESIEAHDDAINSIDAGFGDLVFTGAADGTVKVWRREMEGRLTKHCLVEVLLKQNCAVTAIAVSCSTAVVYSGASDGLVNFWDIGKRMKHGGVLRGHKSAVLCLAVGGKLVMSGSADKSICVWRNDHGGVHNCLSVLTGHAGPVKCLAAVEEKDQEEDGGCGGGRGGERRWRVYSGSLDKSVKVWRVHDDAPI